jgi:hypothetical protein
MNERKSLNILSRLFMGEMDGNEIAKLPDRIILKKRRFEEGRVMNKEKIFSKKNSA